MARMYKDIMTSQRAEPEYFRVGFYGQGFPTFLQVDSAITTKRKW